MECIQMTQDDYDSLKALVEAVKDRQSVSKLSMGGAHAGDVGDSWHSDDFKRAIVDEATQNLRHSQLTQVLESAEVVEVPDQNLEVGLGSIVVLLFDDQHMESFLLVGYASRNLGSAISEVSLRAPFGKELKGKRYGDTVAVGASRARVLDILSPSEARSQIEQLQGE